MTPLLSGLSGLPPVRSTHPSDVTLTFAHCSLLSEMHSLKVPSERRSFARNGMSRESARCLKPSPSQEGPMTRKRNPSRTRSESTSTSAVESVLRVLRQELPYGDFVPSTKRRSPKELGSELSRFPRPAIIEALKRLVKLRHVPESTTISSLLESDSRQLSLF